MRLTSEHRKLLEHESGIDSGQAENFKVESSGRGIAFRYIDFEGVTIGLRTKLVPALKNQKTGKTIRYLQDKGLKLTCYFCESDIPKILNPAVSLVVTEGEKKAISLKSVPSLSHLPVVSYPGCWNWGTSLGQGVMELSTEWETIPLNRREIIWIPDTDYFTSYQAHLGMSRFCEQLVERGAVVKLIDLRRGK